MAKLVSKRYGDALFAVALEENRLNVFFEAAQILADAFRENIEFVDLLCHPKMMKEDKMKMISETFASYVPKEMIGLLVLMVTKNREKEILPVLDYFMDLVKKEKKIGKAEVITAFVIGDEQKVRIENKLLATTEYEIFEMEYKVDEALIGGMMIRIDDRIVDSSIRTKLDGLSRELRSIQV